MKRETYKKRICRLLDTVAPLTTAQIRDALEDLEGSSNLTVKHVAVHMGALRRLGVVQAVPCSTRQRYRNRWAHVAWEGLP